MIQFALFVNRIRLYHCIKDMKRRKSQETSCVGQVSLRYYYHAELLVETRSFKVFNSSTSKQRKFSSQDKSSHWSPSKLIFTQWSTILKKTGTFFFLWNSALLKRNYKKRQIFQILTVKFIVITWLLIRVLIYSFPPKISC